MLSSTQNQKMELATILIALKCFHMSNPSIRVANSIEILLITSTNRKLSHFLKNSFNLMAFGDL